MSDDSPDADGRGADESIPQAQSPLTPEQHVAGPEAVEREPSTLGKFLSQPIDRSGEPFLNGTWEKAGRHPAAAAIVGMLGIGVTYFYGQAILTTFVLLATGNLPGFELRDDYVFKSELHDAVLSKKNWILIVLMLTQFSLMLLPTLRLVRKWHARNVPSYIRLNPVPVRLVLLGIVATTLFFPFNVAILNAIFRLLHIPHLVRDVSDTIFSADTRTEYLTLILVIAVTPAICEEIFFRGFIQRTFERVMGWKSVLLIGFIFGLFHMQPLSLLTLSGMGFLFGFLYYRSGSLLTSMAAHFTNNFLAVTGMYVGGKSWLGKTMNHPSGGILMLALLLEILVVWYFVHLTAKPEEISG